MRVHWIVLAELLLASTGAFVYYYWPQRLDLQKAPMPQTISIVNGQPAVVWPGRCFVAKLGQFDDVLPAYLMFDYLRSQGSFRGRQLLLTAAAVSGGPPYSIWLRLPDDVVAGVEDSATVDQNPLTPVLERSWITQHELSDDLSQTNFFVQAYNSPAFPKLDQIPSAALRLYVQEFICFKASVDPRTWRQDRLRLPRPTAQAAEDLAGNIVEVAQFYDLPVDLLLGIGAMENNFLDVPGDLNNAIWKKDIETDDIVLRRRGRKAWVLNSSIGIWQITRQSLRYAHQLFLCDTRDYSKLPLEFRPTPNLDMNFLSSRVLTTYAALLLRDLLDYFGGNPFLASAAYNGSKLHPSLEYASGVETVAGYARRVIGNTARLRGTTDRQPSSVVEN